MKTDRRGLLKFLTGGAVALGVTTAELNAETDRPKVTEELIKTVGTEVDWKRDTRNFDIVSWAIYDRMFIPPVTDSNRAGFDVGRLAAFSNPIGHGGHFRRFNETNMYMPRYLPAPEVMHVERLFFVFDGDNDARDMISFQREVDWRFFIGCKVFAAMPMIASSTTTRLQNIINDEGYPTGLVPADTVVARRGGVQMTGPNEALVIPRETQFYMEFGAKYPLRMRKPFYFHAFLDGALARPIQ